jgi:short-subunit dehydrogenase involved in D-alanine esterification of teichoic acids
MLLIQILGGLTGIGIAYAMHRFVERKYERITAEARVKYLAEMEEIRQAKNR